MTKRDGHELDCIRIGTAPGLIGKHWYHCRCGMSGTTQDTHDEAVQAHKAHAAELSSHVTVAESLTDGALAQRLTGYVLDEVAKGNPNRVRRSEVRALLEEAASRLTRGGETR